MKGNIGKTSNLLSPARTGTKIRIGLGQIAISIRPMVGGKEEVMETFDGVSYYMRYASNRCFSNPIPDDLYITGCSYCTMVRNSVHTPLEQFIIVFHLGYRYC